ncbi:hypothetical protein [Pedobacter zeae]|uniref:3-keto-disaccharide hydrolase domain-containing protein n=1 Tax=Pedobacter zeae TaxID=1737356 RepID=A0A7W6P3Q6_9SPHI|nr:hypothetical protein [Pedobacter zeae]MBB4106714.1 hypothetical protein [Pedobacter zeae]GGH03304.1 hypothetical protein GCM10007422_18270 [Pedobacter zeae]
MTKKLLFIVLLSVIFGMQAVAQYRKILPSDVLPFQVTAKQTVYQGKDALALEMAGEAVGDNTLAILKGIDFHNGIIEATISGQPGAKAGPTARGFVGIAFRAALDAAKMEVFYLRPTNGRANDQVRRNHSSQYISIPGFPWEKLRKETPEKYEAYVDIVPAEWIKIKIVVQNETASLYVNGSSQPTLIVNDLKQGKDMRGSIGLWIGPGTLGHFTDVKVTKLD